MLLFSEMFRSNLNTAQSIKSVADAAEPTMKMECSTGTQVNDVQLIRTFNFLSPSS